MLLSQIALSGVCAITKYSAAVFTFGIIGSNMRMEMRCLCLIVSDTPAHPKIIIKIMIMNKSLAVQCYLNVSLEY